MINRKLLDRVGEYKEENYVCRKGLYFTFDT